VHVAQRNFDIASDFSVRVVQEWDQKGNPAAKRVRSLPGQYEHVCGSTHAVGLVRALERGQEMLNAAVIAHEGQRERSSLSRARVVSFHGSPQVSLAVWISKQPQRPPGLAADLTILIYQQIQ
jgi:hypothetical protein